ncbi:MAG: hypothetical protein R6W92_05805 [Desulfocurvibacter africanus]
MSILRAESNQFLFTLLRIVCIMLLMLALLGGCRLNGEDDDDGGGGGGGDVEYDAEDNDTPGTAQQVSLPVTIIGFVRTSDDPNDYFRISPDEDLRYRFLLASFNSLDNDLTLYLYDAGENVLASSDTDDPEEAFNYTLNDGEIYYVRVQAESTVSAGASYVLSISEEN